MTGSQPTIPEGLVPSQPRELATRSAALVRRGLHDLEKPVIGPDLLPGLNKSLRSDDFGARLRAAQTLIGLAPHLTIEDEEVGWIVITLAFKLHGWLSHPNDVQTEVRPDSGPHRHLDLGHIYASALQALVGHDASIEDAILQVLIRSQGRARQMGVHHLVWSNVPRHTARHILQTALRERADAELTLLVRWAFAMLFRENPDSVYHDLLQHYVATYTDSQLQGRFAIAYLYHLRNYVSGDVAADCFCAVAPQAPTSSAGIFVPVARHVHSLATSCSRDAWLRMINVAWSRFLRDTGNTHLAALHPARNPSEVRALLHQALEPPRYVPQLLELRGPPARSLKDTVWGQVLSLLMDASASPKDTPMRDSTTTFDHD